VRRYRHRAGGNAREDAPVDLLQKLARAPGAEAALSALEGEEGVFVVGGAVRDALMDRVPRELDFVVEGPAEPVARRAARSLGGDTVVHDRFGTTTVRAAGVVFDVVSARSETYTQPGALPDVRTGATLAEDLQRRDFTVNTFALPLGGGDLAYVAGAREDLEAGVLRVLHDRSFEDDPTRLLRLARYAARLGFQPDPHTDELASRARLDTASGGRLGTELRLLLREPQPDALLALERHGIGAALLPGFAVDPDRVRAAVALCDSPLVALAACLERSPDLERRLDELEFDAHSRRTIVVAAGLELPAGANDVDLWRALRRVPPEAVAVAGARGDEAAARRWLDDVRHRKLAVTGDDFVAAGLSGPAVGEALEAAQVAALEGEAPGAREQLAAGLAAVRPS
jgi:tRNA nucleotidyltransferase (CCA-adding enzyme)